MNSRALGFVIGGLVVLLIGLYTVFFTVHQTENALVLQFGKPVRVIEQPGLQVKLPYQNVVIYDRRLLDFEPPAEEVIAADQKRLVVDTYARFKITNPLQFYQSVGTEAIADARLSAIISATLRRIIGNVELQAVISSQRADIMRQIRDEVNTEAKGFGIDVVDVRLRRVDLPEENAEADLCAHEGGTAARGSAISRRRRAARRADSRRCRSPARRDPRRCAAPVANPARRGRCPEHQDLCRRLR